MRRSAVFIAALVTSAAAMPAAAAQALLPHRAIYDLGLIDASDRSGISGVAGRMVYEFNGSPCEGYSVNFRSVTRFHTAENAQLIDQQVATFEDPANDLFTFFSRSFIDEKLDKEVRGTATDGPGGIEVELTKPNEGTVRLGKAMFPAAHMIDLLDRARNGEHFFETAIFDGTENGDQVLTTTVVIGDKRAKNNADPEAQALGKLAGEQFWPVSIAYYGDPNPDEDSTPIYRIEFKLYENGVARDFRTDYGDFQISGKIVELTALEAPACK